MNMKELKMKNFLFIAISTFCAAVSSAADIIVCDQSGDQSIRVYDASLPGDTLAEPKWTWSGPRDTVIPASKRKKFLGNLAECKPTADGKLILVAACSGCWAVVDYNTCKAIAWGDNKMMSHSIELVGDDVVAVVATGGKFKGGLLYLFDIKGEKAISPEKQNSTSFWFDNPHGLHWDSKTGILWVVDTPSLTPCAISRAADGKFILDRLDSYSLVEKGVTYGHDLRPVPGTRLLALTTHEKVMFFDMDKRVFLDERSILKRDVKAYDPGKDGKDLVTTARIKWWTDTIEICEDGKIRDYKKLPGARIYKARWK
jgi:hypothetical protein